MRFAATANTKSRVRAAIAFGHLPAQSHTIKPFGAIDDFLETQKATAKTQRERLNSTENVCTSSNAVLAMFVLSAINARVIERFQATRRVGGASNRTVNMDVGGCARF